jgi:hypothetical protein
MIRSVRIIVIHNIKAPCGKAVSPKRLKSSRDSPADRLKLFAEIQKFYGLAVQEQKILDEPSTQQFVWDRFRNGLNFQNISVDDLAFIYENTLIQEETRRQLGIHSTPPVIAELMVDHLPFESLPLTERRVLEPFAGNGVFLVAALRRLRELLPVTWTDEQRHAYLRERLTAVEIDTFAAEVCRLRLSLTLADYPNPNGWEIISQDIFDSDVLKRRLRTSQIVLCNPPFEDFTTKERQRYGNKIASVHKPQELLRRVLENPPAMFGLVLPKSTIIGDRYRGISRIISHEHTSRLRSFLCRMASLLSRIRKVYCFLRLNATKLGRLVSRCAPIGFMKRTAHPYYKWDSWRKEQPSLSIDLAIPDQFRCPLFRFQSSGII